MWDAKEAQARTPQQVKVEVKNRLARVGASICYETIAGLIDAAFDSDSLGGLEYAHQQRGLLRFEIMHRGGNVLTRNNQDVLGSLRVDILKSVNIIVLVN